MEKPQFNTKLLKELAFDADETAESCTSVDCTFNGAVKANDKATRKNSFFKTVE